MTRSILIAMLLAIQVCAAAQFTTLYAFKGPPNDGSSPLGGLTLGSNGILYGSTIAGGSACAPAGCGIVFSLTPPAAAGDAWTETVLLNFDRTNGTVPRGALVLTVGADGPVLYGTTLGGGTLECASAAGGCGVVFSLTAPAAPSASWAETIIHAFAGTPRDGGNPYASVTIGARGVLYGTTFDGVFGSNPRYDGTIFALIPPSTAGGLWTDSVIHHFSGGNDGLAPLGGVVIGPGGVLYGTTSYGGTNGGGTVYSLTPPTSDGNAWTKTVLYSFTNGSDGADPSGVVIGKSSTGRLMLYGTTPWAPGGAGGTVFSLAAPTSATGSWTFRTIYTFTGSTDGNSPNGVVVANNGTLYGVTAYGGTGSCDTNYPGCGTVFSLTPPADAAGSWAETVLYNFTGGSDGSRPMAALTVGTAGGQTILYGTTARGASGFGAVFSLQP